MKISIDCQVVPIESVSLLYQRKPFPGNYKYTLELHYDNKKDLDRLIQRHGLDEFNSVDWSIFFLYLIANWSFDENVEVKYFINNVTKVSFDQNTLSLEGVSSPVLRKSNLHYSTGL